MDVLFTILHSEFSPRILIKNNKFLIRYEKYRLYKRNSKIELLKRFDTVLGLSFEKMMKKSQNVEIDKEFEQYILSKIEERKQAKLEKDYAKSDAIRDELKQKGVTLIDTKEGTTYKLD